MDTIRYRISKNKKKNIKFNRLLDNTIPRIPYFDLKLTDRNMVTCHNGQRKLLFTEIEFLSIVAKEHKLSDCLVLYIGAAEGYHIPILHRMFPDVKFLLIDPRDFYAKLYEQPDVYTIINEFYTDDITDRVLKIANGRKILFISDIRVETTEENILNDIFNQQKWLILLDAEYYMLKFRLPYIDDKGAYLNKEFDSSMVKNKIVTIKKKKKEDEIELLNGDIYIQLYPPSRSSETRLIGKKKNNKFEITTYSISDYDEKLNYYNNFIRNSPNYFKESEKVKYHLLGYDDGYDSVGEYYIMYHYILNYLKKEPSFNHIIELLYEMNVDMYNIGVKYILYCLFNKVVLPEQKELYQDEIKDLPKILNYQMKYIKKSNILTDYQKKKMIKIVLMSTRILGYGDRGFYFKFKPKISIK